MKNVQIKLLLLTSLMVLASCQEKVAPELSNPEASATAGGSGGAGGTGGGVTATHDFRVYLSTTPTGLTPSQVNQVIHKANDLVTSTCEVNDVVDAPATLDSTRDITCFVESEEQALYFQGATLKASADADTCNYIVQQPYSYWKYQPGASIRINGDPRVVVKFDCTALAQTYFGATVVAGFGANPGNFTVNQLCGTYVNVNTGAAASAEAYGSLDIINAAIPTTVSSVGELCTYNYGNTIPGAPNCDEGSFYVHTVRLTTVDNPPADGTPDSLAIANGGRVLNRCGGNTLNCMSGVAPTHVGRNEYNTGIRSTISTPSVIEGGSMTLAIPKSYPSKVSNVSAANFMRQCSGMINFGTAASFDTSGAMFTPAFDADIMDEYSRLGIAFPGAQETDTNGMDVLVLGDDPLRAGITGLTYGDPLYPWRKERLRAEPFYGFYCLDDSFEVKARIRVAVREWNKNYNSATQEFRYISDVFNAMTTASMDAGGAQTNPYLIYDQYNDYADLDDWLTFDDPGVASCSGSSMDTGVFPLKSPLWFPGIYE